MNWHYPITAREQKIVSSATTVSLKENREKSEEK